MKLSFGRALAVAMTCGMAFSTAGSASSAGGLSALSDRDLRRINESGCEFGFGPTPRETLVFGMNNKIMIRVGAQPAICPIAEARFSAFAEGKGSLTCGGRRLTLRRTGSIVSSVEADSAAFPAELTISRGSRAQKVRGMAGTAC
jgi:hypothetical protein